MATGCCQVTSFWHRCWHSCRLYSFWLSVKEMCNISFAMIFITIRPVSSTWSWYQKMYFIGRIAHSKDKSYITMFQVFTIWIFFTIYVLYYNIHKHQLLTRIINGSWTKISRWIFLTSTHSLLPYNFTRIFRIARLVLNTCLEVSCNQDMSTLYKYTYIVKVGYYLICTLFAYLFTSSKRI